MRDRYEVRMESGGFEIRRLGTDLPLSMSEGPSLSQLAIVMIDGSRPPSTTKRSRICIATSPPYGENVAEIAGTPKPHTIHT